ncbi:DEAD/DEAH box helicase [Corallococcus coralloides]|uniref:DEAD/DEAH box helicase n=1 Tax=Corallococcus coralloides TaxID=184914 RepID=UPI00384E2E45
MTDAVLHNAEMPPQQKTSETNTLTAPAPTLFQPTLPDTLTFAIQAGIDLLGKRLRCSSQQAPTHRIVLIEGWGDDAATIDAIAAYFVGLLAFIIGGYDINASAIISESDELVIPDIDSINTTNQREHSGRRLWLRIKALCQGKISPINDASIVDKTAPSALLSDIIETARTATYTALCQALDGYFAWLRGAKDSDIDSILSELTKIRDICRTPSSEGTLKVNGFSDIFHLTSLLLAAISTSRNRSVVRGVPPPTEGEASIVEQFSAYLKTRAIGTKHLRGRPFLWPSTIDYVKACLPGPSRDAVVSMPTGSGKSFLAELAVAHALSRGWVLYLTPTNALAHQVRRDLTNALRSFSDVTVSAFVGGAEYTALSDEQLASGAFVGVMTPEKCSLALRLYPETFKNCSLCVFDECHLLNDQNRGTVADVLLAQLFHAAPSMRVLLMSAMVSNADELADWLTTARREAAPTAVASRIKWRPSRTARGFVLVDKTALNKAINESHLPLTNATRALTIHDKVPLGWIAGLSGPWTRNGPNDYRTAPLPIHANLKHKRSRTGKISREFESWKNRTGLAVSELLASRGAPAINFVLSSRHHAFGTAERVSAHMPGSIGSGPFPGLVEAQMSIADSELGVETCLRGLLRKGVAVHTSAMLQVEQAASEWMFAQGKAKLMIATGTLAQGLNLPAVAVVVSGSQLAGQQWLDSDAAAGLTRANELILNGFGRAGRPGFANQGVVILVSDKPFQAPIAEAQDGAEILKHYPVLGEPDASIAIHSPIEKFLDELLIAEQFEGATGLEVALTSLLSTVEADGENAGTILRRTFGAYRRRAQFTEEHAVNAQQRVAAVKERFLQGEGVPTWMPIAAMRAGVDFFRAQRMWEAYQVRGLPTLDQLRALDISKSFDLLIEVMSNMPISRVGEYLDEKATETPRTRLGKLARNVVETDKVPWDSPADWAAAWKDLGRVVEAFMQGRPLTEIGAALFSCQPSDFSSGRGDGGRGLPAVFKFLGDVVDRSLAQDAGCFLALNECWLSSSHPDVLVPECLQALPLCIKNGANSLDVLAWFRFGYRQRVCAHALAQVFPLEAGLKTDDARARAVRRRRNDWLTAEPNNPPNLIDFARTVVQDGGSDRN